MKISLVVHQQSYQNMRRIYLFSEPSKLNKLIRSNHPSISILAKIFGGNSSKILNFMCTLMALKRLQTSFWGKMYVYGNFEIFYVHFYQFCSFYLYFSIFNKYLFNKHFNIFNYGVFKNNLQTGCN